MIFIFSIVSVVAPDITDPPDDVTTVSPDNATFTCSATARPRPAITWLRGGSAITTVAGEYDIAEDELEERELTSTLTLLGTEPRDAGDYVCQAITPYFSADEEQATLTVQGILLIK